ncbi:MAG: PAS domain S-box protein [Balneolaceae bacterium]|nr:PAS domain S-box protein [Balneolaceae bacterium]
MKKIRELIKSCSKDEESYQKLVKLTEEIIHDKNEAEKELNLLERAVSSDYDSILITTLELEKPGPKIVYVNDGFTRMTGYTKEEVIGKTPRILQGPKTDREVLDRLKERLEKGKSFFGHTVNYRKDGSEFINQWDIHPLTNEDGEITHWVSYQHDITERKRSEKRVVDSSIEFDSLMEESKKILADIDVQGNIVDSNKAFRDLTGYDEEELKKRKVWELLIDEQIENFRHKFVKFKPSDFSNETFDLILKNKKGNDVEVKAATRLLTVDDQMIVRASFENRSLQKRIMSMLKMRNERFNKMYDETKEFRYKLVQDSSGKWVLDYVTDAFEKITGRDKESVSGKPLTDLIHEDDTEKMAVHLRTVENHQPHTQEYRIQNREGKYIEVIDYAKPVNDDESSEVDEIKGSISVEISSEKRVNKS